MPRIRPVFFRVEAFDVRVGKEPTNHFLGPPMRRVAIRRWPQNYLNIWCSKILPFPTSPVVGLAVCSTSEEHQYHQVSPRPPTKSPELNRLASADRPGAVFRAALARPLRVRRPGIRPFLPNE